IENQDGFIGFTEGTGVVHGAVKLADGRLILAALLLAVGVDRYGRRRLILSEIMVKNMHGVQRIGQSVGESGFPPPGFTLHLQAAQRRPWCVLQAANDIVVALVRLETVFRHFLLQGGHYVFSAIPAYRRATSDIYPTTPDWPNSWRSASRARSCN